MDLRAEARFFFLFILLGGLGLVADALGNGGGGKSSNGLKVPSPVSTDLPIPNPDGSLMAVCKRCTASPPSTSRQASACTS